ncbi:MAG: TatD family nuclease-associated radical SAM protein [Eubacteriaceae bacterium]
MTITYELGHSLYVNITNRCSNDCRFCVRNENSTVNGTDNLWLEREPDVSEIIADIKKRDLKNYRELVFCGFGEPTYRFFEIIEVAKMVKKMSDIPIRINTNGHGNRINGEDITPYLKGVIDTVSVSLNAVNHEKYNEICQPLFEDAYEELLDFSKKASQYTNVILSIVDILPPEEIEICQNIADSIGVKLRVRHYIES